MGDTVMDGHCSSSSGVGPTMPSDSPVDRPREQVISNGDDIESLQKVLFSPDRLILKWTQVHGIGAGLQNMGNTCFINSALQCLTYTPPLANYLMSGEHAKHCHVSGFCMMCSMENHISEVFSNSGKVLKTVGVVNELHRISNHFNIGRQGDAHEFLRYTMAEMQKSCLPGTKLDRQRQETNLIHQVFGGELRSRVKCLDCKAEVDSFETYLDIPLAIQKASSLSKALREFVKPDVLDGDNAYSCSKCQKEVTALKGYTFHQSANVLMFLLKRFDSIRKRKITKDFKYPEYLEMQPFMSQTQGETQLYSLYAVMVHSGYSCHAGHYFCYIKWSDGKWYEMNDATVSVSDIRTVLNQQAYLLFYIKSSDGEKTADCSPMNHNPDLPGQTPERPMVKPCITKTIPHNNTGFRIPKLPQHMTKSTLFVTGKGSLRDFPKSSKPSTSRSVGKANHGLASSSSLSKPVSRPKVIPEPKMLQKLSSLIGRSKPSGVTKSCRPKMNEHNNSNKISGSDHGSLSSVATIVAYGLDGDHGPTSKVAYNSASSSMTSSSRSIHPAASESQHPPTHKRAKYAQEKVSIRRDGSKNLPEKNRASAGIEGRRDAKQQKQSEPSSSGSHGQYSRDRDRLHSDFSRDRVYRDRSPVRERDGARHRHRREYRDRSNRLHSDHLSPHDRDDRDRDSARRYEQTVHHPRESYRERSPHHYPRHRSRDDRDSARRYEQAVHHHRESYRDRSPHHYPRHRSRDDRDSARRYEQTVHHHRESYRDRSPHHYPRHRSRDDRDFDPRGNCRKNRDEQQRPDSRVTKSYSRERNSYPSKEETSVPATVSDGSVAQYEGSPGLPPHFMSILAPNRVYRPHKRAADNLIRETNDSPEACVKDQPRESGNYDMDSDKMSETKKKKKRKKRQRDDVSTQHSPGTAQRLQNTSSLEPKSCKRKNYDVDSDKMAEAKKKMKRKKRQRDDVSTQHSPGAAQRPQNTSSLEPKSRKRKLGPIIEDHSSLYIFSPEKKTRH